MAASSLYLRAVPAAPAEEEGARATSPRLVRARIFDAITRAVAEKGYAATTVADVTTRAHISRRTFYEQFTDKTDCLLRAYESASQQTMREIAEATAHLADEDWEGRLEAALRTYVGILAEDPELAHVTLIDILGAGPRGLSLRERVLAQYTDFYRRLSARAHQTGAIEPVSDIFLRGIVGAIAEIVQHEILAGRTEGLPKLLPAMLELARAVLGAPSDGSRGVPFRARPAFS